MRRLPVKLILSLLPLLIVAGTVLAHTQSAGEPKTPPTTTSAKEKVTPSKPMPSELEQLLAEALVHNPDIRVAEAKLREAEAELNRVRFQVLQKVTSLYHAVQAQKETIGAAEHGLQSVIPGQGNSVLAVAQEQAKLASLQAELPALLGRPPQSASTNKAGSEAGDTGTQALIDLFQVPTPTRLWLKTVPVQVELTQGAMADKIRKALDTPVTIDFHDKPLDEVLRFFEDKMGVSFHNVLPSNLVQSSRVNLRLKQVPLGAALQALEDTFDADNRIGINHMRFVVRDYGILVTTSEKLPQGTTLLHDFWKRKAGQEKRSGSTSAESPDGKGLPPSNIEGQIKAADPQSGLLRLNIGSDAGLRKGQTLEVYRVKPQPKYLGPIQILDVRPTEAVARPTSGPHAAIEVGDRVTSVILRR